MKRNAQRVAKHAAELQLIAYADPKTRKKVVQQASKGLVLAVCDCADQVLKGEVKLTPAAFQRLKKHKTTLRKLKSKSPAATKKALLQKGGFLHMLPALIGPAVMAISSLFGGK